MAPKESRFRKDADSDGWFAGSVVFNAMMAKPTGPRERSGAGCFRTGARHRRNGYARMRNPAPRTEPECHHAFLGRAGATAVVHQEAARHDRFIDDLLQSGRASLCLG